jgi:hypothetical protein
MTNDEFSMSNLILFYFVIWMDLGFDLSLVI